MYVVQIKIPYLDYLHLMVNTAPLSKAVANEIGNFIVRTLPRQISKNCLFSDGEQIKAEKIMCSYNSNGIEVLYDKPLPPKDATIGSKKHKKIYDNDDWEYYVKNVIADLTSSLFLSSMDHFITMRCTNEKPSTNSRARFVHISNLYNPPVKNRKDINNFPIFDECSMEKHTLLYIYNKSSTRLPRLTSDDIYNIKSNLLKIGIPKDFVSISEKGFILLKITEGGKFKNPEKAHENYFKNKKATFMDTFKGGYKVLLP